jgi:hypothetical protein
MGFLRDSTPPNSVILSWWDFGYWFQSRGNRTSMADGGNLGGAYHHRDYDIADWFTSPAAAWDGENRTLGYYFDDIAHHNFTMYILMDYTLPGKYGAISKISSRGSDVVGFLQFSQSGNFQQDNRTIVEFKADPYALWVPFDNNSNVVGSPMLLTSQGNQYYSKVYVNDLCTTKGIIHVGDESPKLGGCVALSSVGVFFIPEVAEKNMFVNLMFMDGYNLPVEKVFDNQWIKIYKVDEIE